MTEATAEDAPSDAEVQEAESPLERTVEEADVESSPANRASYMPQAESRYSKKTEYKKSTKEDNSRHSAKKSGLEKALADSEAIGSEHGIDSAEVFSSTLAQRMLYSANSEEESAKKAVAVNEAREIHDSLDGGHAIIAYEEPETGKIYFVFEKKPHDYPISEYAGKLSLYGGSIKIGEPPKEGVGREIMEEDKDSYKIIIKALNETRWKVAEINKDIDGVPSTTHIWLAYIRNPTEVRDYLSSKTAEGDKTPLSLEEMLRTKDSDFAFGFGPIVKEVGVILANRIYSKYN